MKCYNYANWMYVSIHASVKDATYFQKVFLPYLGVSIHASVKDATPISIHQRSRSSFNPRICKRCDYLVLVLVAVLFCFNPRICKRCDALSVVAALTKLCFNPRICKRCDLMLSTVGGIYSRFNPRICKRCDMVNLFGCLAVLLFQSTHL